MMTVSEVNAMEKSALVERFGGIYEHSRWVVERVAGSRPWGSVKQMADQMRAAVDGALLDERMELIRAHPDLAGKLALAGEVTDFSKAEQAGVGLDRLSVGEFAEFTELNTRYRERFGFPFIICVRKTDRAGILTAFRRRLGHSAEEEVATALGEIHEIARLRLEDAVADDQ
jgi:2-oxo-4-hydroxy-4-carboxy-5-ureidoimidazoline decarboxylase